MTTTPLWLALAAGCGGAGDATSTYLDQLDPLLQENGLLAERVLTLAAQIYNDSARPEQIADSWGRTVVPIAEHLADQASFVEPPQPYVQAHQEIVQIWGDRATAYRSLSEAIQTGDTEGWNAARNLADDVKLREESWFYALNERVGPMGLIVDPYP
ncbi:MAG: hypothetical protein R3F59_34705 [Myxococcota bacterium]